MIYKCRFCDFQRSVPMRTEVLKEYAKKNKDNSMPAEDVMLYAERSFRGTPWNTAYSGVKIHMGIKHKNDVYVGMWPDSVLEPNEEAALHGRV